MSANLFPVTSDDLRALRDPIDLASFDRWPGWVSRDYERHLMQAWVRRLLDRRRRILIGLQASFETQLSSRP
jgi:hypothetical protein